MREVAVIILNWNGEHHLLEFLPSVVASTPREVDIIVADNGSTDGSVQMLASNFPEVEIISLDRNYGFAQGYNLALNSLDYKYFVLLNSDVKVTHDWLPPLIQTLEEYSDYAAVAPKVLSYQQPTHFEHAGAAGGFIDYLGYPLCRGRVMGRVESDDGQYNDPRDIFWASGAVFACRAELFKSMGGFDPHFFAHMEEIDLCWRMQLAGYTIRYQPQSVVYHLGGGTLKVDSARKRYLNHRNNLWMLLRCAPLPQLLVAVILRPPLDTIAAFSYLLQGSVASFVAPLRAYISTLCSLPRLLRERHQIRSSRLCESRCVVPRSIILDTLLHRGVASKNFKF
ncbi:MAG: glycosyltransferase family 2 protein [Rikenellaceae bacterium]